jgi:hypothetical protein
VYALQLAASLSVVGGVLVPSFPRTGVLWVSLVLSLAFWMLYRKRGRSIGRLLWDVRVEPVALLHRVVVAQPAQRQ